MIWSQVSFLFTEKIILFFFSSEYGEIKRKVVHNFKPFSPHNKTCLNLLLFFHSMLIRIRIKAFFSSCSIFFFLLL